MNALYGKTVFDEWVLVVVARERGGILSSYSGPRAEHYERNFKADIQPLRAELARHKMAVGEFVFAQDGFGPKFDACIRVGASSYLFCNNTAMSISEIREKPLWLAAQKPFADLSAKFRADPLE